MGTRCNPFRLCVSHERAHRPFGNGGRASERTWGRFLLDFATILSQDQGPIVSSALLLYNEQRPEPVVAGDPEIGLAFSAAVA
jgi:hypothetical protein